MEERVQVRMDPYALRMEIGLVASLVFKIPVNAALINPIKLSLKIIKIGLTQ